MQFTYTFPPILRLGYDVITDAMAADAPYVPGQGASGRVDNWNQWSRWKRVSSAMSESYLIKLTFNEKLWAYSVVTCSSNFSISFYSLVVPSWLSFISYFHYSRSLAFNPEISWFRYVGCRRIYQGNICNRQIRYLIWM